MNEYLVTKRTQCLDCGGKCYRTYQSPYMEKCLSCGAKGYTESQVSLAEALRDIHIQQAKNDPEAPSFLRAV